MWHTLRLENIIVPRYLVADLMRELDLEGCEQRTSRRLKRRTYFSPEPNHTCMVRRWLRQVKTFWFSHPRVHRRVEQEDYIG